MITKDQLKRRRSIKAITEKCRKETAGKKLGSVTEPKMGEEGKWCNQWSIMNGGMEEGTRWPENVAGLADSAAHFHLLYSSTFLSTVSWL